MKIYIPNGKIPAEKVRDLVGQATATGEFTVATIDGIDVVAWPGDDPATVFQDYTDRVLGD